MRRWYIYIYVNNWGHWIYKWFYLKFLSHEPFSLNMVLAVLFICQFLTSLHLKSNIIFHHKVNFQWINTSLTLFLCRDLTLHGYLWHFKFVLPLHSTYCYTHRACPIFPSCTCISHDHSLYYLPIER